MTQSVKQTSFVGGEWAPSLYARTDLAKYLTAVRKMLNFIPHPHGSASNRGGTQYVCDVKYHDKYTRLIPFQFSVTQAYVLEFGDQYIRVIMDGGQVVDPTPPHPIVEVATPYLEADLRLLKYTQSADVLYVTHPNYAPRKLSRTAHHTWTLSIIAFGASVSAPTGVAIAGGTGHSYVVTAVNAEGEESIASSAVTGGPGNALTWSTVTGASYYKIYKDSNASGVYGWIGQANGLTYTEPTAGIAPNYLVTPPTAQNPFGGVGDYPGVATFFEQRLVFARPDSAPQKLWGSVTGSFENMNRSTPLRDDDAYRFTINARQVNEIRWLVPVDVLLIGTSGSEWKMQAGDGNAITPSSVDMKMQSQFGVSHVQPLVIGNAVLFIEGSGDVVRDFSYNFDIDGYTGNDLTVLANHLFRNYELTDWCFQQHPDSVIWCVRSDGALVGMTYFKEHEVWGWHRHTTDGKFEAIASIKSEQGIDEVYMVVEREISGSVKRYIERFMPRLPVNDDYEHDVHDAYFVDCGLTYDNPLDLEGATVADPVVLAITGHGFSDDDLVDIVEVKGMTELNGKRFKVSNKTTNDFELTDELGNDIDGSAYSAYISGGKVRKAISNISGMDHLEGKTVAVFANGNVIPSITISSGAFALPNPASRIHIGLPYVSDIETMDYEFASEDGTIQDKVRDVKSVVVKLENTRSLFIGPNEDRLDEVPFRDEENYGEAIRLYTGDKEVFLEPGHHREARMFIRNPDPVPVTLLGVIPRIEYGES